ncbi:putative C2H2 finger domain protein [Aspergillus mulundensis]|uniref:C2H2-type domain-containing protein n=1 Tax=Aspergillus mulundensis TaxID=1810919 RepID=A0A3D8RL56_9EURO|nr:hypothetical protein DSM5745_07213 [Aspergillus mulundensis]RDW74551.1 hypothetical protein DSM5745_07213 [Aspergillus mulundensis]
MEDHYNYSDFHHYGVPGQLPIAHEVDVQYYPHHDANVMAAPMPDAMMGCVPVTTDVAVKGAPFPPFDPLSYPPPPSPADMGYWCPPSPFDESIRSVSPQTDCQSNYMPALSYDDSTSCASGFESSPSPSYPEFPMTLYKQEPMSPTESTHPMPQQNHMFLQVYTPAPHQPSKYTNPAEREASKPTRKSSSRKDNTRTRVQKRTSKSPKKTPAKSNRTEAATTSKQPPKKTADRRFECCFARYGCTSTFPSKNEWKRHVSSQHIQLGFYRCDVGRCSLNNHSPSTHHPRTPTSPSHHHTPRRPTLLVNDFNRKDLFIQHQRRMHAPWTTNPANPNPSSRKDSSTSQAEKDTFEASLDTVVKRCWRQLREPPTLSHCGFCAMEFRGANAWKERMEHVARHFEKRDPGPEREDLPLRQWAENNGVVRFVDGEWKLASLCGK